MAFFYYNNFGGIMELIIGKYSGFCNGVKYTVDCARNLLDNNIIYSLGDIVHNEIVINELKSKGLIVKNSIDEIPNNSKVIIRAHGEIVDTYKKAKEKNIELIDLTCGKVKLIHNKILNKNNCFVIIIGKKNHPETIAHKSYSNNSFVIESIDEVKNAYDNYLNSGKNMVYVVAQTTFNSDLFDKIVDNIKEVFNTNIYVDKTICNATSIRQNETKEIAKVVNKMIIIGGKNSSNTKELAIIAKEYCNNTFLIQTSKDLDNEMFNNNDIIGITAGASTPEEVINDVVDYLDSIYKKRK